MSSVMRSNRNHSSMMTSYDDRDRNRGGHSPVAVGDASPHTVSARGEYTIEMTKGTAVSPSSPLVFPSYNLVNSPSGSMVGGGDVSMATPQPPMRFGKNK